MKVVVTLASGLVLRYSSEEEYRRFQPKLGSHKRVFVRDCYEAASVNLSSGFTIPYKTRQERDKFFPKLGKGWSRLSLN